VLERRRTERGRPGVRGRAPELLFKAPGRCVVGAGEPIGIRADSTWDVPEPELVLALDAALRIVAYTIGNDVSSRSLEGENTLYLPQAKTYERSCAIGPGLVPASAVSPPFGIRLRVERGAGSRSREPRRPR
jgi:2-dehydro-3-deoxy-D-arabinonate dehydratase